VSSPYTAGATFGERESIFAQEGWWFPQGGERVFTRGLQQNSAPGFGRKKVLSYGPGEGERAMRPPRKEGGQERGGGSQGGSEALGKVFWPREQGGKEHLLRRSQRSGGKKGFKGLERKGGRSSRNRFKREKPYCLPFKRSWVAPNNEGPRKQKKSLWPGKDGRGSYSK